MQVFSKKFNAQRSADRQFRVTGDKHVVRPAEGGFVVLREEAVAPAPVAAPVAAVLPTPPDFTAKTHKPYRAKLAKLVELAQAGDIAGLEAVVINPTSTSPKAMIRYRTRVIAALEAREA